MFNNLSNENYIEIQFSDKKLKNILWVENSLTITKLENWI
jgi:hypothetical protein